MVSCKQFISVSKTFDSLQNEFPPFLQENII